ncbi:MAG: NfeD family protein [Pseudomonadota bacterium]
MDNSVILTWIGALGGWSWAVLGAVLLGLELLIPGIFLFWFGLAALALAVQIALIPVPWQAQIVLFLVYSGLLILLARRLDRKDKNANNTDAPDLNARNKALVGRVATLAAPIKDGFGEVRLDDTIWRVKGPDTPAGRQVRVSDFSGALLTVEVITEAGDGEEGRKDADVDNDGGGDGGGE